MISIEGIKKTYSGQSALNQIDLQVEKGELFGLIGPDGSGKTSLFRILCTLNTADSGKIKIKGEDHFKSIYRTRSLLGYMPQKFSLYQDLSVKQNLCFFAELFGVSPEERAEKMDVLYGFSMLKPFEKRRAGALSGGMKQKLALSCALIHTPEILVLDEPTFGVDPLSRREFWDILRKLKGEGVTTMVSTAYMDEADMCDRVALIYKGDILDVGTPDELKERFPFQLYSVHGNNYHEIVDFFMKKKSVKGVQMFGDAVHVSFAEFPSPDLWNEWAGENTNIKSWEKVKPSMEDVFLEKIESGEGRFEKAPEEERHA